MDANLERTRKNIKKYFNQLEKMNFKYVNNIKPTRKGFQN